VKICLLCKIPTEVTRREKITRYTCPKCGWISYELHGTTIQEVTTEALMKHKYGDYGEYVEEENQQ